MGCFGKKEKEDGRANHTRNPLDSDEDDDEPKRPMTKAEKQAQMMAKMGGGGVCEDALSMPGMREAGQGPRSNLSAKAEAKVDKANAHNLAKVTLATLSSPQLALRKYHNCFANSRLRNRGICA